MAIWEPETLVISCFYLVLHLLARVQLYLIQLNDPKGVSTVIADRYLHCFKNYWSTYGQSQALLTVYRLSGSSCRRFTLQQIEHGFNLCLFYGWQSPFPDSPMGIDGVDQPFYWCLDTLHRHSTRYTARPYGGVLRKDIDRISSLFY